MNLFWTTTICIGIFALKFQVVEGDKVYEIKNSWKSGFQGEINIPVTEETEFGWKFEIMFHKPIQSFECYVGELKSMEQGESGSRYIYKNFEYNKILKAGTNIKVEFNGAFIGKSGPKVPPVTIKFQNKIIYTDHYDLAGASATISTTDIVYVLDSLTKATQMTPSDDINTPSASVVPKINDIHVNEDNSNNEEKSIHDVNQQNNQKVEEMNNKMNEKNQNDLDAPETSENGIISDDYDVGSGEEVPTYQPPGRKPARRTKYPYIRAIQKSLLFYEAQRSGPLPSDNRIPWRGDSAMRDAGEKGEDLKGGYYDAGDHVKFGFPMAFSMTTLAWGVIEYWEAYEQAGQVENALKALKWGADYILKAYTGRYEFYGQVGIGKVDHEFWGRAEDMTMERPAFKITAQKPGSDLAAESSAALSAASIAFERSGIRPYAISEYINKLRQRAEGLYEFATTYRGLYQKSIKDAEKFYASTNDQDEIVWGVSWLYRATGKQKYLVEAEGKYQNWVMFKIPEKMIFSWDDKTVGIQVLLSQISEDIKRVNYLSAATAYCKQMRNLKNRYTPKGLLFMDDWSPLRYAANIAFICQMVADQGGDSKENFEFAQKQIHYMLGDTGRSYVVGFGRKYPKYPHHRGSSCKTNDSSCNWSDYKSQKPNPNILHGALVGGPNKKDKFFDNREKYISTEVTLDHNSCFQGAVAGLLQRSIIGITRPTNRSHEPWYHNLMTTTTTIRTTTTSGATATTRHDIFMILFLCTMFFAYFENY